MLKLTAALNIWVILIIHVIYVFNKFYFILFIYLFNDYLKYSMVTILYGKQLLRTGLSDH